jgi:hypothetical protein
MAITLTGDPRHDLERLPSETLYTVARNEAAAHRALAIRILVERGSDYALQPEIADEARELVLNDPIILKQIDPATAIVSLKLPGIVDVLADNSIKRAELAELVDEHHATNTRKLAALESTVSSNHAANAQSLASETGALGQAFIEGHRQLRHDFERQLATLGSTVTANKVASEAALLEAYTSLWRYFAQQQWWFSQTYDSRSAALEEKLDTLRTEQAKDRQATNDRLALLERSWWRRLVEWYHNIVLAGHGN